jgi:hypothetical protein
MASITDNIITDAATAEEAFDMLRKLNLDRAKYANSTRIQFSPAFCGRALMLDYTLTRNAGTLTVAWHGAEAPEGEDLLRRRLAELLGNDWTRALANGTLIWLRDMTTELHVEPSRVFITEPEQE